MADANIQVKNQESKSNDNEKPSDEGLPGKEASAGVVSKRQVLSALKLKNPGILSTLLGLILLFPMKVLSMFGLYHLKKRELYLSGQPLIDRSPLKPLADDAPEKRKLGEDESTGDESDEDMQDIEEDPYKYLRDGVEYDSQEDEDYKPPPGVKDVHDDSAASDEFQEGETDEDDVNVDPNDIIEHKTRAKKHQLDVKESEKVKGGIKGQDRTGSIQFEQHNTNEEKAQ